MSLQQLSERVREHFADGFVKAVEWRGDLAITVTREKLHEVAQFLHDDPAMDFDYIVHVSSVDWPDDEERFEVVYEFYSIRKRHRIRLKTRVPESDCVVDSLTDLWKGADFMEREVYDMYGVLFEGNADLRRILTDYGFEGFPQRKDFPLTGYVELRYSEEHKRVIYEPVKLAQDFRSFDFMSPWEGAEYILPGDEKAQPEAKGAPTPLKADEVKK